MKILLCVPGYNYSGEFLIAWTKLVLGLKELNHEVMVSQNYSSFVPFARSKCLGVDVLKGAKQKPFNGLEYDVMVWIDSDMLFTTEMVLELANSPYMVTAGLYKMDDNKHFAVVKDWDTEFYVKNGSFKFLDEEMVSKMKQLSRYIPVAYSGMGLMAIKKNVFDKLEYPYFHYDVQVMKTDNEKAPEIREMCSEDVAFCRKLADAGVPIMIDLNIRAGHQKRVVLV
jgi:hypothetical protein